jgi:hypothetical protein
MLKVIITGTTGFVGEGVLLECLKSKKVEKVLSVSRRSTGRTHPKLEELIIPNFKDLKENDPRFQGYNACFYCAGKSSNGMKEPEYRDITLETPVHFSKAIGQNKDMTFIYVSGAGAGSNSWFMWARVKAEAENYFINMKGKDFKDCYVIRPGIMKASSEQNNVSTSMKLLGYCSWMFGNKMEEIGKTMIQLCLSGYEKNILETKDIDICAKKLVE